MNFDSLYKLAVERKENSPVSFNLPDGYEDQYGSADQPPAANFAQDSQSTKATGEEYTDTDNNYSAGEAWDDIKKGAGYVKDRYDKNMRDLKYGLAAPYIRDGVGPTTANQFNAKALLNSVMGAAKGLAQDYSNATGMTDTMIKHGSPYWKQAGRNARDGGVIKQAAQSGIEWLRDPESTIGKSAAKVFHEPGGALALAGGPLARAATTVGKTLPITTGKVMDRVDKAHRGSYKDEGMENFTRAAVAADVAKKGGLEAAENAASADADEEESPKPALRAAAKIEQPEEGWWNKLTHQGTRKERRASSDEVWDAYRDR